MGTNFKFFEKNHVNNLTSFTFTSADTTNAVNLYDNDYSTKLVSVGSDDLTNEVWEFQFNNTKTVSAIHLVSHNIKEFDIEYWNGSAYVDFSVAINETTNAETTNFYDTFTEVTTLKIRLTMKKTITADQEKSVGQFRVLESIGELVENPAQSDPEFNENSINLIKGDNGNTYINFGEKFRMKMKFSIMKITDYTLFKDIKDNKRSFYIYPGGGADNQDEGFRLQDMYLVNWVNDRKYKLPDKILIDVGKDITIEVREV